MELHSPWSIVQLKFSWRGCVIWLHRCSVKEKKRWTATDSIHILCSDNIGEHGHVEHSGSSSSFGSTAGYLGRVAFLLTIRCHGYWKYLASSLGLTLIHLPSTRWRSCWNDGLAYRDYALNRTRMNFPYPAPHGSKSRWGGAVTPPLGEGNPKSAILTMCVASAL